MTMFDDVKFSSQSQLCRVEDISSSHLLVIPGLVSATGYYTTYIRCSIYVSWFQLPHEHQKCFETYGTVALHAY